MRKQSRAVLNQNGWMCLKYRLRVLETNVSVVKPARIRALIQP